jgi:hypothetical protein
MWSFSLGMTLIERGVMVLSGKQTLELEVVEYALTVVDLRRAVKAAS